MQLCTRAADGSQDDALGQLMYDAIHYSAGPYDAAQRHAWLPAPNCGAGWRDRLAGQQVIVAHEDGAVIGFMTRRETYIELAFVHPDHQRRGIFRVLYKATEAAAQDRELLRTHASLMAQPAFEAVGFHVIRHEHIERAGQRLARAEMEKSL